MKRRQSWDLRAAVVVLVVLMLGLSACSLHNSPGDIAGVWRYKEHSDSRGYYTFGANGAYSHVYGDSPADSVRGTFSFAPGSDGAWTIQMTPEGPMCSLVPPMSYRYVDHDQIVLGGDVLVRLR
jgi:hypothetical protein